MVDETRLGLFEDWPTQAFKKQLLKEDRVLIGESEASFGFGGLIEE